jgi:hypothetical protein
MVYDPTIGKTVMYGGMSLEPDHPGLLDMWAWDGTDWSSLPALPALGGIATALAYAPDGALILTVWDGQSPGSSATWTWHGSSWVKLDVTTPDCVWCELAYDPKQRVTVMVTNPKGAPIAFNEVWTWDGARWSQRS